MHQGGRARACRSIGKKDVHVARAHFAAVDAVGRAGIALDAARNVERIMLVEFGRRLARSVVDVDCNLRMIAARASAGSGEDHVVHVGGAQRLVRCLAHDPAQRLDQIGFARSRSGRPRQ